MKRFVFSIIILAVVILTLVPNFAFSASFDCDKASTDTEKLICSNDDLGLLDETLSGKYKQAITILEELDKKELKSSQRVWLKLRDKNCDTVSNCKSVYSSRITDIEKLISSHAGNDQLKPDKIIKHSVSVPKGKTSAGASEIILSNEQEYTVPPNKIWVIENVPDADCRVCTSDAYVRGEMSQIKVSGVIFSGVFEITFTNNSNGPLKLYPGTKIWLGDSRTKLTVNEIDK